jgi:hypothetical protein
MYYVLSLMVMDGDGPVGRPVVEELWADDVWVEVDPTRLGWILRSLAVEALVDDSGFRSPLRDWLDEDRITS